MITVHRRYAFSASHRLNVPAFDDARNDELFGKCNNPFGHGHNYSLELSVEGQIDPQTARAVDLNRLDALVNRTVLSRYDHRNLNVELPEFATEVPTTENLAAAIRTILEREWTGEFPAGETRLKRVRIYETDRNIIDAEPEVRGSANGGPNP